MKSARRGFTVGDIRYKSPGDGSPLTMMSSYQSARRRKRRRSTQVYKLAYCNFPAQPRQEGGGGTPYATQGARDFAIFGCYVYLYFRIFSRFTCARRHNCRRSLSRLGFRVLGSLLHDRQQRRTIFELPSCVTTRLPPCLCLPGCPLSSPRFPPIRFPCSASLFVAIDSSVGLFLPLSQGAQQQARGSLTAHWNSADFTETS